MTEIKVLDKGFVRLDGSMADDLSVVRAARVSFAKEAEEFGDDEAGLVRFLMTNKHGTPFEHNALRLHVKCPIFVMREWIRHRIGSFNEQSARYSVLDADFYIPDFIRHQVGKPGAYTFEPVEDEALRAEVQNEIEFACHASYNSYAAMLEWGIAKEVARVVLPVNIYTSFYWTVNARSLMNFLSLRTSPHAMFEIREYALRVEDIWAELMPVTHAAFIANGKVAP